jgi:hypothetical protein
MWSNLTTLELFGGDSDAMDYLDSLINTPAVKHLKLNTMSLRMDDFEFIHNTLSSLNALTLLNIDYTSTRPPKNIVPASSVTSFQFFGFFIELPCRQMLLLYILQKYPNLSELSFCISTDYEKIATETEFSCDEWDELIAALAPRLQTLRIQLCCSEEFIHVVQALDDNNCQLKSLTFSGILCDEIFDLLLTLKLSRRLQ